jgi:hypothetical protein
MMIASVPSSDTIDLSTIRIRGGGAQVDVVIQSSITRSIYGVDMDEFMTFRSTAAQNATKIVFHVTDSKIYLKTGLTSYGTITLYYPRLPIQAVTDGDYVDLPDGVPMSLAIGLMKKIVGERLNVKGAFNPADMQSQVYDFWKAFDSTVSFQDVKDKMKALT